MSHEVMDPGAEIKVEAEDQAGSDRAMSSDDVEPNVSDIEDADQQEDKEDIKQEILNDEILGPLQQQKAEVVQEGNAPSTTTDDRDFKKEVLKAAEKNAVLKLQELLSLDPELAHIRDDDSYTPMHRAAYNNNVEVIKILLSYNADPNARTQDQWTPLHCACQWDSVEAVSLLLQNGALINARSAGGLTPLHLAASGRGKRCLELLLWQPWVDGTITSDAGETAYMQARKDGPHLALFEMLEDSINTY